MNSQTNTTNMLVEALAHCHRMKLYFEKYPPQDPTVLESLEIVLNRLNLAIKAGL